MPHTNPPPKPREEYWHLCANSSVNAFASALIHLRARLNGASVTIQIVNPFQSFPFCPPKDAIILLHESWRENADADEYPFPEFNLRSRPSECVLYYKNLPHLAELLKFSSHYAVQDFAYAESVSGVTNQSLLLTRLYQLLGHDEFAAYIAHRLYTQPACSYRILQDEEALDRLLTDDEIRFYPEEFTHVDMP